MYSVLNIEQTDYAETQCYGCSLLLDLVLHLLGYRDGGEGAGGISRMDACLLDMLHHCTYVYFGAVRYGIHI